MKSRMIDYYMSVAELTAKLSRARRLQVGCVIVRDDNIISFGWNGTPPGWDNNCEDEIWNAHNGKYELKTKPEVIHAEANALIKLAKGSSSSQNSTMFLTHAPCLECAKLIASSGIGNLYYRNLYRNKDGVDFLHQSKIPINQIV